MLLCSFFLTCDGVIDGKTRTCFFYFTKNHHNHDKVLLLINIVFVIIDHNTTICFITKAMLNCSKGSLQIEANKKIKAVLHSHINYYVVNIRLHSFVHYSAKCLAGHVQINQTMACIKWPGCYLCGVCIIVSCLSVLYLRSSFL